MLGIGANFLERILGGLILDSAAKAEDDGGMFKCVISIEGIAAAKLLLLAGRQCLIESQLAVHYGCDLGLRVFLHIEHTGIDLQSALCRPIVLKLKQKGIVVDALNVGRVTILKDGL